MHKATAAVLIKDFMPLAYKRINAQTIPSKLHPVMQEVCEYKPQTAQNIQIQQLLCDAESDSYSSDYLISLKSGERLQSWLQFDLN